MEMLIHKYIPDRMYGFTIDDQGRQAFFHLGAFQPGPSPALHVRCAACSHDECSWIEAPPPPIHGERVEVTVNLEGPQESSPRASRVVRMDPPLIETGVVDVFYSKRGFGFIKGEHSSFFLHRSEMLDGKVPIQGQQVLFCVGTRDGKPRACYIKVCEP